MWTMFGLYQMPKTMMTAMIILSIWVLVWKGIALWHTARNGQKNWFVVILILNTLGLLPIIYLIWFKPKTRHLLKSEVKIEPVKKVAKKKVVKKKTVAKKATKRKK